MILGNKADLKDEKIVDEDVVKKYCDHRSMEYFEASAKTAENVNKAFVSLTKQMMKTL